MARGPRVIGAARRGALGPAGVARAFLERGGAEEARGATAGAWSAGLVAAAAELDLGEEELWLAWELVRCVEDAAGAGAGLSGLERGALQALVVALLAVERQGSTRLALEGTAATATAALVARLGGAEAWPTAARLLHDPRLAAVVGAPGEHRPLIREDGCLYPQRSLHLEERLARGLAARLARDAAESPPPEEALAAVADAPVVLGAEQRRAVLAALGGRLARITGGPGTGKTSIVVAILRALVRQGVPASAIALAAPTGKAADRMREAIERGLDALGDLDPLDARVREVPAPRTLHRLLGYAPGDDRFRRHPGDPLAEAIVIVDECSMIDLHLMDRLLGALRPDARLVLLGDAEQLPPIEAGAAFRDLIDAPGWPEVVRLVRSYRVARGPGAGEQVLRVAARLRDGDAGGLLAPDGLLRRRSLADLAWEGVELLDAPAADPEPTRVDRFLRGWTDRVRFPPELEALVRRTWRRGPAGFAPGDRLELERLFAHAGSHLLLAVTRSAARPTGAAAVNERLHRLHVEAIGARGDFELVAGEPVVVERNRYDLGLWNGDQGLVLWVSEGAGAPRPHALFLRGGGRVLAVPVDALRGDLGLAFAVTVHRAQGSERDHVALLLPDERHPLVTRELLYTAVTRARRSALIVGRAARVAEGVGQLAERSSGLAARLRIASPG